MLYMIMQCDIEILWLGLGASRTETQFLDGHHLKMNWSFWSKKVPHFKLTVQDLIYFSYFCESNLR